MSVSVYFVNDISDPPVFKGRYDVVTLDDIPESFSRVFVFHEDLQMIIADITHLRHVRLTKLREIKSVVCVRAPTPLSKE